ncbi:MAG: hypothetical protein ACE5EE_08090 [Fidelibacterota bacterium]
MAKDILKFDTGRRGFERATVFLLVMAGLFAIFGIIWIYRFLVT